MILHLNCTVLSKEFGNDAVLTQFSIGGGF
jgi:hypothetical protein